MMIFLNSSTPVKYSLGETLQTLGKSFTCGELK